MSLRIMIVDDEAGLLDGLKDFFQAMGHTVFATLTGDEAVKILEKETLDVALCDLTLQNSTLTGLDVVKEITVKCPNTKVIIMTGHGRDKVIYDMCMKYNPYRYFDKPLDLLKIQEALKELEKNTNQ